MRGILITFEGIDFTGKTTQSKRLFEYISRRDGPKDPFRDFAKRKGMDCVLTREPGGTKTGRKIREVLLNSSSLERWAELFLYLASRSQLMEEVIKPSLSSGKLVIVDRFSDSTFAYQGYGRKLPLSLLKRLNKRVTEGIKPDLTFLLDDSPEKTFRRKGSKSPDRLEREGKEFQKEVRVGYLKLAKEEPYRFRVIKVEKGIDETFEKIKREFDSFLSRLKK